METRFSKLTRELGNLYPIEYDYCSTESLYSRALNDRKITRETFNAAKKYYDIMWDYVGD